MVIGVVDQDDSTGTSVMLILLPSDLTGSNTFNLLRDLSEAQLAACSHLYLFVIAVDAVEQIFHVRLVRWRVLLKC